MKYNGCNCNEIVDCSICINERTTRKEIGMVWLKQYYLQWEQ